MMYGVLRSLLNFLFGYKCFYSMIMKLINTEIINNMLTIFTNLTNTLTVHCTAYIICNTVKYS